MGKFHVYMSLHIASNKSTVGSKTRLFPRPFLILAKALPNNHVAACSTALRSSTEKNEMGGYVTVPFLSKTTQRNSTDHWLKF